MWADVRFLTLLGFLWGIVLSLPLAFLAALFDQSPIFISLVTIGVTTFSAFLLGYLGAFLE